MDKNGFIEFNTRFSAENSGKAESYAQAITILEEVLPHHNEIDLKGHSLYELPDAAIDEVIRVVKEEVKKMRTRQQNIFDTYGRPNQRSYPLNSFCSAALKSLKKYAEYEREVVEVDKLVALETNPKKISKKLIDYFDITKEGEDVQSVTKRRKGQDYFRHMILANYGGRCALTGISVPQMLLASHIIPWLDKSHKKERLNPCNGICLSALYDKAFDKGLMTISPDDYSVQLSSALRDYGSEEFYERHFGGIDGRQITKPIKYEPNRNFLAYHRDHVFVGI